MSVRNYYKRIVFLILILFSFSSSFSETIPVDSLDTPDSLKIMTDSLLLPDSLNLENDSLILSDTLTDVQRVYELFKIRQEKLIDSLNKEIKTVVQFSFEDTLSNYLLTERLNLKRDLDHSYFYTAGDYYKMSPSYIVTNYQNRPQRTTVAPFGLKGNRTDFIINGLSYTPFEHFPEPEGLIDYSDIPTALNDRVYTLPGPVGLLFGGKQVINTLYAKPNRPTTTEAVTRLLVDKGSLEYNYIRGSYSKLFLSGKEIDLAVEYRNGDGFYSNEDQYHYNGRAYLPLGNNYGFSFSGLTYRRKALFAVPQAGSNTGLTQERKEHNFEIRFDKQNQSGTNRYQTGVRYSRYSSHFDIFYKGRFDSHYYQPFVNGTFKLSNTYLKTELSGQFENYKDGFVEANRSLGRASFVIFTVRNNSVWAASSGAAYVKDFDLMPFANLLYKYEKDNFSTMASIGYAEKPASLHELNLSYQTVPEISYSGLSYAESGNKDLKKEKQLTAHLMFEFGSIDDNLRLSATGGRIKEGIEWGNPVTSVRLFSPVNEDVDFAAVELRQRIKVNDFLYFLGGGSYLWNKTNLTQFYQPEFQLFSGGEMHLYWKQKDIDLYGYGEIVYTDEFFGYNQISMGKQYIVNMKLSFKLKKFKFYYTFQNLFNIPYQVREGFTVFGRTNNWGFTWSFLN